MAPHGKAIHLQRTELLQSLADRAELTELIYRLTAALDEHRFDDMGALAVDDVVAQTPGGTVQGRDAVVAQVVRNHEGYDRLQHLVSGVVVDLDGDRATVRANVVAIFGNSTQDEPVRELGVVNRYQTVRTEEGWRIEAIQVSRVWLKGSLPVPAVPVAA